MLTYINVNYVNSIIYFTNVNIFYVYVIPISCKSFLGIVIPFALIRGDTYSPFIMYPKGETSTRLINIPNIFLHFSPSSP